MLRCIQEGRLSVFPAPLANIYQHTERSATILEESRNKMLEKHLDDFLVFGKLFTARKIAHMWADVAYQYEREDNREKMKEYAIKSVFSYPIQTPGIYLILIDALTGCKIKTTAVSLKHKLIHQFQNHK